MHKEILTKTQVRLLPLVKSFARSFYLVGGTAIALHLGHRQSIDFDLFTDESFDNLKIRRKILSKHLIERVPRNELGQYTIVIAGVYMTFFHYPFAIPLTESFDSIIKMPDLLTLSAMKAFALGRRAKWKDYVDLYFVMREHHGIAPIADRARAIYGSEFNERSFREQLAYFDDINYSEKVVYMPGFAVSDATVKKGLKRYSLE